MLEEPPLFLPADFFLIRVPSFPIDYLFSLLKESDPNQILLEKWLKDSFFRQALAFASKSLSAQIRKDKINEDVIHSLFKYFSRITSRATPYGLFSFVGWGEASERARSKLDWNLISKRARPDMGWIRKYTDTIFQDKSEFLDLELQNNPIILEKNDRYIVKYFIDKKEQSSASIKKNKLSSVIFSYAKVPLKAKDLIELLESHFPNAEREKILQVINSLIEQQFLWFTLYPKINLFSFFRDLIHRCPAKYKEELSELEKKIQNYNSMPFDQGEEALHELSDQMSKKADSLRLPIQMDLGISSKQLHLPQKVLKDVAKGAEILWQLSLLNSKQVPLKEYHSKFLGKYGLQRLVPLFALLDSDKGLGLPNYDDHKAKKPIEDLDLAQYQEWLASFLCKGLWNKQKELILSHDIVSSFCDKFNKKQALNSLDVFFEIYANSKEDVELGNCDIYINNFVDKGGATFGRFIDLLDLEVLERLKKISAEESKLDKDTVFLDSFYLPQNSDVQNVAVSPSLRSLKIDLLPGQTSALKLDEIYIGATKEFLYLTNVNGEVEFRITSTNVLVDIHAPEQLRFIKEVSRARSGQMELWSWGPHSSSTYLPRVRYQNIILSCARWWTTLSLIGAKENEALEGVIDKLSDWLNQFDVPRYVYIAERDNKLLIDRHFKDHIKIAASYLRKNKRLFLLEKIGQEKGYWVESSKGKHAVEYVLPLIKNAFYANTDRIIPRNSYFDYKITDRWKLPGSEWLYSKFYLSPTAHNFFLQNYLSHFSQDLIDKNLIKQWFFIRYQENQKHQIRFRIKVKNKTVLPEVFKDVYQFSQDMIEQYVIQEMDFSSYERELERYGGIQLMDLCEELFCIDSYLVLNLLQFESEELPIYVIGAISVIDLLQNLQFNINEANIFFNNLMLDKNELKGYKEWKKKIESGFVENFGSIGEKRASLLKKIANKMKDSSLKPSVSIFSLASSLIHMHCNRLCGIDPNLENKIKIFSAHYIESFLRRNSARLEKSSISNDS